MVGDRFLEEKKQKKENGFELVQFEAGHRIGTDVRLQFHILESNVSNKSRECGDSWKR